MKKADFGKCEKAKCARPATVIVQDVRETEPVADEKGQRWRTWERDGAPHRFCAVHKEPARETMRDGTARRHVNGPT